MKRTIHGGVKFDLLEDGEFQAQEFEIIGGNMVRFFGNGEATLLVELERDIAEEDDRDSYPQQDAFWNCGWIRSELEGSQANILISTFPWETIANLMDDEIREQVHAELAPCANEEFLVRYMGLHEEKYGEEFQVN